MNFNVNTFIVPINSDVTLRIRDTIGNIITYIKVPDCTVSVSGSDVLVKQQSESNTIKLSFNNQRDAITAQKLLREALILLKQNINNTVLPNRYLHLQPTPLYVWFINHGLGEEYNHVTIYDDDDFIIIGQIEKVSHNSIQISFNKPVSGKALLS